MTKPNTFSKFYFNPFSGVTLDDIQHIIVPQFDLDTILNMLHSDIPKHIEFLGRQGRGKTTHLKWIASQIPEIPLYLLHSEFNVTDLMMDNSEMLFIDSIHHLSIGKRIQLFKSKKTIIFTTHWSRKFENIIAKKKLHTINFKGIEPEQLKSIIDKRLSMAAVYPLNSNEFISIEEVNGLIRKHKDNYRGIINQLFDKYQL